jgi:hypothetical protein
MKSKETPSKKTKAKRSSLSGPDPTNKKENRPVKTIPQTDKPKRKKPSNDKEIKLERNSSRTLRKNHPSEWVTPLSLKSTLTDP